MSIDSVHLCKPFSQSVQSNIGKQFIHLIDKHFPKSNTLPKIFNRNSCKIGYSCMNNMGAIIKQHNAEILKPEAQNTEYGCNCRTKADCPLEGACLTPSLVYKATVNTENERPMHYIGMTDHKFKSGYRNRKLSFNNKKYAASTTLSSHIWNLKKNKKAIYDQGVHCETNKGLQKWTESMLIMPRGKDVYFECV